MVRVRVIIFTSTILIIAGTGWMGAHGQTVSTTPTAKAITASQPSG
jgi:hypothetical protein